MTDLEFKTRIIIGCCNPHKESSKSRITCEIATIMYMLAKNPKSKVTSYKKLAGTVFDVLELYLIYHNSTYAYKLGEGEVGRGMLRRLCDFSGKMLTTDVKTLARKQYKIMLFVFFISKNCKSSF